MQKTKWAPILLWICTLFAVCLVLLGLFNSDPLSVLFGSAIGGLFVCFFAPFLAANYVRRYPWRAIVGTICILISVLYANAYACRIAGTRDIHPLDHAPLLLFCVPGALSLLIRGIPGRNSQARHQ